MMLSFGTLEISIIMKVVIAMSRSPIPSGVSYVCADINPDISRESCLNLASWWRRCCPCWDSSGGRAPAGPAPHSPRDSPTPDWAAPPGTWWPGRNPQPATRRSTSPSGPRTGGRDVSPWKLSSSYWISDLGVGVTTRAGQIQMCRLTLRKLSDWVLLVHTTSLVTSENFLIFKKCEVISLKITRFTFQPFPCQACCEMWGPLCWPGHQSPHHHRHKISPRRKCSWSCQLAKDHLSGITLAFFQEWTTEVESKGSRELQRVRTG